MVKSLQLQAEMTEEFGACVFDVTLDCEDGAPVGGEIDHANMVLTLVQQAQAAIKKESLSEQAKAGIAGRGLRIAVRVHPVGHLAFAQDVALVVGGAGVHLSHLMIPKVETVADVERAAAAVDRALSGTRRLKPLPLHVLIESPAAVHRAFDIAAHPRVESISFGLMDFVASHGGAIPASAMGVAKASPSAAGPAELDQFSHPLVVRAKLEIASACHAWGKVPSHCVVTEFNDAAALTSAAGRAAREFGYTRMWSIHPSQIRPIIEAFAPAAKDIDQAAYIIAAAQRQDWAPISVEGQLHDRASYRYFWQVLERAHQTGRHLPAKATEWFADVYP